MKTYIDKTGTKYSVRPYQIADAWNAYIKKRYKIAFLKPDAKSQFDWERYAPTKWHETEEAAERELDEFAVKKGWTLLSDTSGRH